MRGPLEDVHLLRVKSDANLSARVDLAAARPLLPGQLRYAPRSEAHLRSMQNDVSNGAYGDGRAARYDPSVDHGIGSLYIYERYTTGMTKRDCLGLSRHRHHEARYVHSGMMHSYNVQGSRNIRTVRALED